MAPDNNRLTKQERFKKIASKRTQRVLNDLRLLGNCSNRNSYSYKEEDVRKIFRAIESELRTVKSRFNENSKENKFVL